MRKSGREELHSSLPDKNSTFNAYAAFKQLPAYRGVRFLGALFDELRFRRAQHAIARDLYFADIAVGRDLVHYVRHQILDDGTQTARARFQLDSGVRDLAHSRGLEGKFYAV